MKIILCVLILFIIGCSSTTTFNNRDKDQENSLKLTKDFYEALKEKDLKKIFPLFSFSLDEKEAEKQKVQLYFILRQATDSLGEIESYDVISNKTKVIETGNTRTGDYVVTVKLKRALKQTFFKDSFKMYLIDNKIKILSYTTNPF